MLVPLVRQPRARSPPDRARPRAARERRHRPRDARAAVPRAARRRGPADAGDGRSAGSNGRDGIVREVAVERGWDLEAAAATISLARFDAVLEPLPAPRRRDRRAADARSRPARGGFGDRPGDRFPAADLGEFQSARRDRPDRRRRTGYALIRDYKLSAKVIAGAKPWSRRASSSCPSTCWRPAASASSRSAASTARSAASKEDRPRGLLDKDAQGHADPGRDRGALRDRLHRAGGVRGDHRGGARRGDPRRRRDPRPAAIDRNPRDGSCPTWCRARSDLPDRARRPRASTTRTRRRTRSDDGARAAQLRALAAGRGAAAPAARPPTARTGAAARSEPRHGADRPAAAAIDNRDRDVFLEAGAGTGKTRVLVDRYCEAVDVDGDRARADPRLHVHREGRGRDAPARPGRARPPRRGRRATRRGGRGCRRRRGRARRLRSRRSTASAGACSPPIRSPPGSIRGSACSTPTRPRGSRRISFDEALAALAADRRRGRPDRGRLPQPARLDRPAPRTPTCATAGSSSRPLPRASDRRRSTARGAADARPRRARSRPATRRCGGCWSSSASRFDARQGRALGVDFDDLQLLALELLRSNESIAEAQRDPLRPPARRRVPGHEPDPGRARPGARRARDADVHGRRRAPVDLRLPRRRPRQLPRASGHRLAAGAGRPGHGNAAADRQLPLRPPTSSRRSTPSARRCSATIRPLQRRQAADRRSRRCRIRRAGGRAPADPVARAGARRTTGTLIETVAHRHAAEPDRRGPRPRAAPARARRRKVSTPGSMVVLLRAFTHVDAYAEALELRRASTPTSSAAAGYWSSQQVTDALGLLACVANPLDDEALLGALASPACAVSPGRALDAAPDRRAGVTSGRRSRASRHPPRGGPSAEVRAAMPRRTPRVDGRGSAEQRLWAGRLPDADRERLARVPRHARRAPLDAALLPLDELVERVLEGFGYDLAALLMDDGLRRTANLLKLVRIAGEYEAHEGRDLRGFLDQAARARGALRPRGRGGGGGRGPCRGPGDDRPRRQGPGVRLRRGRRPRAQARRRRPAALAAARLRRGRPEEAPAPRIGLRLARAGAGSLDVGGYRQINDDAADADAEESGRLAYVAASRARERLILSGLFDPDKDIVRSEKPRRGLTASAACCRPSASTVRTGRS